MSKLKKEDPEIFELIEKEKEAKRGIRINTF